MHAKVVTLPQPLRRKPATTLACRCSSRVRNAHGEIETSSLQMVAAGVRPLFVRLHISCCCCCCCCCCYGGCQPYLVKECLLTPLVNPYAMHAAKQSKRSSRGDNVCFVTFNSICWRFLVFHSGRRGFRRARSCGERGADAAICSRQVAEFKCVIYNRFGKRKVRNSRRRGRRQLWAV